MIKEKIVSLRMCETEYNRLQGRAEAMGINVAEYLRNLINIDSGKDYAETFKKYKNIKGQYLFRAVNDAVKVALSLMDSGILQQYEAEEKAKQKEKPKKKEAVPA